MAVHKTEYSQVTVMWMTTFRAEVKGIMVAVAATIITGCSSTNPQVTPMGTSAASVRTAPVEESYNVEQSEKQHNKDADSYARSVYKTKTDDGTLVKPVERRVVKTSQTNAVEKKQDTVKVSEPSVPVKAANSATVKPKRRPVKVIKKRKSQPGVFMNETVDNVEDNF